jgi:hypothetical protein
MAPTWLYQIIGTFLCAFVLFIPVGIAYLIARRIQRAVWKRQEEKAEEAQPI